MPVRARRAPPSNGAPRRQLRCPQRRAHAPPQHAGSNGEIGLVGVTKGSAIIEVLDLLGIDPTDAIGIGDSWNDAPMFEVVGTPIAMGNAAPELQRLAGDVTTAVLDDGIHNAFSRLGLIGSTAEVGESRVGSS